VKPTQPKPSLLLLKDLKPWERRKNLVYHSITQDNIERRNQQLTEAVKWCKENSKRGWAALKTGKFTLIKDPRTINSRLDNNVKTGAERDYCSILTSKEEESLVRRLKNKNRAYQAMDRKKIEELVIKILKLRKYTNRAHRGRKGIPLSENAKSFLITKKLGKSFWKRFDTKHTTLSRKRQSSVSIRRALNCTRDMAIVHLDELADELIGSGIFTDARKIGPGKWRGNVDTSRIFNHDETPQFVNYNDKKSFVYCGKGDECKKLISENRECVTIHPFVSLSGEIILCHVIFKGKMITNQMCSSEEIVSKFQTLLISTTENGVQTHESLLEAYTGFKNRCVLCQMAIVQGLTLMSFVSWRIMKTLYSLGLLTQQELLKL